MKAITHPKDWKVVTLAEVGTDEAFVRESLELVTILRASLIEGKQREDAQNAIVDVQTNGLIPAFLELRSIRESRGKDLPLLDQYQMFEDLSRKLWKSYKDLAQRAAKSMGFECGFIWQEETKFEEGLKKFQSNGRHCLSRLMPFCENYELTGKTTFLSSGTSSLNTKREIVEISSSSTTRRLPRNYLTMFRERSWISLRS